jgi:hypothetical protein
LFGVESRELFGGDEFLDNLETAESTEYGEGGKYGEPTLFG